MFGEHQLHGWQVIGLALLKVIGLLIVQMLLTTSTIGHLMALFHVGSGGHLEAGSLEAFLSNRFSTRLGTATLGSGLGLGNAGGWLAAVLTKLFLERLDLTLQLLVRLFQLLDLTLVEGHHHAHRRLVFLREEA